MTHIHYKTFIILAVISISSLGYSTNHAHSRSCLLAHSYNSSHTQEGVLSTQLGEDLVFNYTDSFTESTFQLSLTNLNLTYYNILNISFIVEGDRSTSSGISITFNFDSLSVVLIVDRHYQDDQIHSLNKGFFFNEPIVKDFTVNVTISGKANLGQSGSITVYQSSSISNVPLVELSEEYQSIQITPESLSFEGNMVGTKEVSVMTVINNTFNESFVLDFSLSFSVNDFQSFTKEVIVSSNSTELERTNFFDDQLNTLDFQTDKIQGCLPVYITFQIDLSSDLIQISNLNLEVKIDQNSAITETLVEINWIDGIDENVDISFLKPQSALSEQVLNISLFSSFEGTVVFAGIDYEVIQGSTILSSGTISANKQNGEIQLISIDTFTTNYQEDLFFNLQANAVGSGTITIYNSTSIEIRDIVSIDTQIHQLLFEESRIVETPSFGSIAISYYDALFIQNASMDYRNDFIMVFSISDQSFDSITLNCYINQVAAYTKTFRTPGDVHVSEEITLVEGINELKYTLTILGGGSEVTFENLKYTIQQTDGTGSSGNPTGGIDIPFFQLPKNIFLGIFVLFDCWLLMGIMLRIYKGRKHRKSHQAENDEFILEIAQMSQDY